VGIGVLAIRAGVELAAQQLGGGQERERRSGTQNVLGAVGLATALRVAAAERVAVAARAAGLREVLADGLMGAVVDAYRTVPPDVATLPGHLHLCFPGIEREELLVALGERGICASGGSSCASGALEPSRVLIAMEVSAGLARGAIRFTLGRQTTTDEIAYVVGVVPEVVGALRHGG
jgi:cysteine desulfurase